MRSMGKTFNLLTINILALFIFGCNGEHKSIPAKNHHLLVFIDKSASVAGNADGFSTQFAAHMDPILNQTVQTKGDRVAAYLIHGSTTGNAVVLEKVFKVNIPTKSGKGPETFKSEMDNFQNDLLRFRKQVGQELINYLEDKCTGEANRQTDALGSLEVISTFMNTVPKGDTCLVVYMSDMVHAQAQPRNYNARPLKDLPEAKTCAEQDFAWLQTNRKVDGSRFENLQVHIIFPSGNTQMTQNDKMMYYWEALFGKVCAGVKVTRN